MNISYESCTTPPDREPMTALLKDYYELMIARVQNLGGPELNAGQAAIDEFWAEIDAFLPPNGRLILAKSDDGTLLGCGSLKTIGDGRGELKRLFVRPETRGHGVGRKLVELRLDAARVMGLKTLIVDTLKNNVEMRGLYESLGFQEAEFLPESATFKLVPELQPYLCFYTKDL